MIKYYKNFILCDDAGYYCLICREMFLTIPELDKHIDKKEHKDRMVNREYFPNFKHDFIYLVADRLYCEVCNFTTKDLSSILNHMRTPKHKTAKNNAPKPGPQKYNDAGLVLLSKMVISVAQWNSIIDGKCHLCHILVKDLDQHLASDLHSQRFLDSEPVHEGGQYYRKLDSGKYHCFVCGKLYYSEKKLVAHWSWCENNNNNKEEDSSSSDDDDDTGSDISIDKDMSIDRILVDALKEYFDVDDKKNLGTCKRCSTEVTLSYKVMREHMTNIHNDEDKYVDPIDHGKRRHELSKYGKENFIKLNHNGSKGWCTICNRYMSAHMNVFKDHVNGALHTGHLEVEGKIKEQKKCEIKKFNSSSVFKCVLELAPGEASIYVNYNFCIDVYSFFFLHQIEGDPHFKKTKCFLCNELFPQGEEKKHCVTVTHKNKFTAAKVVDISPTEFIREIRPNLYHCGFCNQTMPYIDTIPKHLKTWKHRFGMIERTQAKPDVVPIPVTNNDDLYCALVALGLHNFIVL